MSATRLNKTVGKLVKFQEDLLIGIADVSHDNEVLTELARANQKRSEDIAVWFYTLVAVIKTYFSRKNGKLLAKASRNTEAIRKAENLSSKISKLLED